jgi:hypothetical protein
MESADRLNPNSKLASGVAALADQPKSAAFDQALAAALARGDSPSVALARAQAAYREQLATSATDSARREELLAQQLNTTRGNSDFEAIAMASLARGFSLEQAVQRAREKSLQSQSFAAAAPDLQSVLSTGAQANKVSALTGKSKAYRAALGKALAQGRSLQRAVSVAQQAEQAATVALPLPREIRDLIEKNPASVKLTSAAKGPAPQWIRLDQESKQFIAVDIPEAGLPITLVLLIGDNRYAVTVTEILIPGVPLVAKID